MEITVADQRILICPDIVSSDEAKTIAFNKKVDAFGTLNKVAGLFSRPKDEDFELIYNEHRYEPFWHVLATARYVYDRNSTYQVKASGLEVTSITSLQADFPINQGQFKLPVVEHCTQTEKEEVIIDGVTGQKNNSLKNYFQYTPKQVTGDIHTILPLDSIVVPPTIRISAIMRDALAKMIKGIQADAILEELVQVERMDLYYRPIYSYQYRWISKNLEAITEIDGVTGESRTGNRTFGEYLGKVLDTNFLFDVGADAAGMFIPGGSIAVKVAKKYIDSRK